MSHSVTRSELQGYLAVEASTVGEALQLFLAKFCVVELGSENEAEDPSQVSSLVAGVICQAVAAALLREPTQEVALRFRRRANGGMTPELIEPDSLVALLCWMAGVKSAVVLLSLQDHMQAALTRSGDHYVLRVTPTLLMLGDVAVWQ